MLGRLLAALAYVGLTGALVPLAQPNNLYVVRHARRGIAIHLLRVALIAPVLSLPLTDPVVGRSATTISTFARDLSLLVMLGIPGLDALGGGSGVWILLCLALTWGIQFIGFMLAVSYSGRVDGVADQPVGQRGELEVDCSRGHDAEPCQAGSPTVLDRRGDPRLDDLDHRAGSGTKRTVVPGSNSAGGVRSGSNSSASTVPSSCQPPGVWRG